MMHLHNLFPAERSSAGSVFRKGIRNHAKEVVQQYDHLEHATCLSGIVSFNVDLQVETSNFPQDLLPGFYGGHRELVVKSITCVS